MSHFHLRIVLPLFQVPLALVLFFSAFVQYRTLIQASGGGVGLEFHEKHWPPPAERLSRALNFPATIVAAPLNYFEPFDRPLVRYNLAGGESWITLQDVAFFIAVGFLWYWVGKTIDVFNQRVPQGKKALRKTLAFLDLVVAFTLGVGSLWASLHCLTDVNCAQPAKQTAWFGLIWSVALLSFAVFRLKQIRRVASFVR